MVKPKLETENLRLAALRGEKRQPAMASAKAARRMLMVAHNHPQFFPGGAEILAYDLFKALREETHYVPFFMAAAAASDRTLHTGTPFQAASSAADEILFWGDAFDHFYQSQRALPFLYSEFRQLLLTLAPEVIHFHHTMRIGVEALRVARDALPQAQIVYTLHEFMLMCHRDGQMIRTQDQSLCRRAEPAACHRCFPEISPAQFRMRESFIRAHLSVVDQFISPSCFLAERFVQWGLPAEKMVVMENGRHLEKPAPLRALPKNGKRNVFAYFGQINPYKGVMLLLGAARQLVEEGFEDFRLEIFGNVGLQTEAFQQQFHEAVAALKTQVRFHGTYRNEEMPRLMEQADWVVIPSTWWENSPLVIQEAFMHRRPVICSNIGGMAEKVTHHTNGLHFEVGSERALAAALRQAAEEKGLHEKLSAGITPRLSIGECAQEHAALYDRLCADQRRVL